MSAYREFTGKSVEEALRNAREAFGAGLDDLDFEILTPGSRGVLGMGAEPARIVAAPRSALGGAAPKRDAAASVPLPQPPREERSFGDRDRGDRDRGPRRDDRGPGGPGDRGPRRDDRGPRPADRPFRPADDRGGFRGPEDRPPRRDFGDRPDRAPASQAERSVEAPIDRGAERAFEPGPDRASQGGTEGGTGRGFDRGPDRSRDRSGGPGEPRRGDGRGFADRGGRGRDAGPGRPGGTDRPRRDDAGPPRGADRGPVGARPPRDARPTTERFDLTASEVEEVNAARGSLAAERAELEAAEASPEALKAGQEILEELMKHLGFDVRVEVESGETSRLNVVGDGEEKEALGALIGRKGERLSALQHLVNLMLSRRMDAWTRVLVDVEDYRGPA